VGAEQAFEIYRNDAGRAIKALAKREQAFNLIFLDPPYRMHDLDQWLLNMQQYKLIADGCFIVVEHDVKVQYPLEIDKLVQKRHTQYGEIAITIYHYIN